jgi:hypothetical protein
MLIAMLETSTTKPSARHAFTQGEAYPPRVETRGLVRDAA